VVRGPIAEKNWSSAGEWAWSEWWNWAGWAVWFPPLRRGRQAWSGHDLRDTIQRIALECPAEPGVDAGRPEGVAVWRVAEASSRAAALDHAKCWTEETLEKYQKEIEQLLHRTGAKLLRRRRHEIYRLQSGRNFV
jgi:hypothetical protein